jgi:hypothetical protein
MKDAAERSRNVIRRYLGCRDLVKQWLELVVVIPIQQNHVDVMLGELLGASDSSEPASHNEHGCITHATSPLFGRCRPTGQGVTSVQPATPAHITPRG